MLELVYHSYAQLTKRSRYLWSCSLSRVVMWCLYWQCSWRLWYFTCDVIVNITDVKKCPITNSYGTPLYLWHFANSMNYCLWPFDVYVQWVNRSVICEYYPWYHSHVFCWIIWYRKPYLLKVVIKDLNWSTVVIYHHWKKYKKFDRHNHLFLCPISESLNSFSNKIFNHFIPYNDFHKHTWHTLDW